MCRYGFCGCRWRQAAGNAAGFDEVLGDFESTLRGAGEHFGLGRKATSEDVHRAMRDQSESSLFKGWGVYRAGRRALVDPKPGVARCVWPISRASDGSAKAEGGFAPMPHAQAELPLAKQQLGEQAEDARVSKMAAESASFDSVALAKAAREAEAADNSSRPGGCCRQA